MEYFYYSSVGDNKLFIHLLWKNNRLDQPLFEINTKNLTSQHSDISTYNYKIRIYSVWFLKIAILNHKQIINNNI